MLRGILGFGCCALGFAPLGCGARTELGDNVSSSSSSSVSGGNAPGVGPDHSCKSFHACGGDPVGTWTVNSQCSSPAADYILRTMCADAKETRSIGGSMSFSADGSLVSTLEVGYRDVLPPFCAGTSCGMTNSVYASCTPGASGYCVCDFPSAGTSVQQIYQALNQTVIVRQGVNDPTVTLDYCVLGDELFLSSGNDDASYNLQLERDNGQ